MKIENRATVISEPQKRVRDGWSVASQEISATCDDSLVWPEFANEGDEELVW